MKTITYRCDNSDCLTETNNIEESHWIEIGSSNNKLYVNNHLLDRHLISMGNHSDIHFCSSKCFTKRFVEEKEKIVFTENEIQQLQSKIHKITGDGEVMMLFNEMLGINAGS